MYRMIRLTIRRLIHTDKNSQAGQVSSHNSQIIWLAIHRFSKSQTRKSQAQVLEGIEFRLCEQRDIKIVVWIMLIPQADIFQQEINT